MRFDALVHQERFLALILLSSACSSSAPLPAPVARPTASVAPPEPEYPATEPEHVGLVLRVRNPGHVMTAGFEWLGLAIPAENLIPSFGKKPIPFDVDAPLDVLMLADAATPTRFHVAVSMPLRSIDEMKDALGDAVSWKPMGHGALRFEGRRGSGLPGSTPDSDVECALTPSSGAAKARFVCAEGRPLAPLLPYFVETLPKTPFEHEIALELRQPFLGTLANDPEGALGARALGAMASASELLAVVSALSSDVHGFASELDGVTAFVDLDARGAHVETRLSLAPGADRAKASRITQLFFEPASGAPEAFFRLPIDADFAVFGSGSPKETFEPIRRESRRALDLFLHPSGWSSFDALSAGLFELARGPWAASVSLGAPNDPAMTKARGLWAVAAVKQPFARVTELARALVPPKAEAGAKAKEPIRLREVKAPKTLGADALALDLTFPVEAPEGAMKQGVPKKLEGVAHVLFASRGEWTWIAASTSEDVAKTLLHEVTSSDAKALSARPEARWFESGALVSGGDLGLSATIDPAVLEGILGPAAKGVRPPPPGPLLYATEVRKRGSKRGGDELVVRVEAPPSLGVGVFLALFKDALTP